MNIICKLFTGRITVNSERLTYSLMIDNRSRGESTGINRIFEIHDATFTAANSDNEIVDQFTREYSDQWGEYSAANIRRSMIAECHENFD